VKSQKEEKKKDRRKGPFSEFLKEETKGSRNKKMTKSNKRGRKERN